MTDSINDIKEVVAKKGILNVFEENGFVIDSVSTFAKEADGIDLTDVAAKLVDLSKKINNGVDITEFAASFSEYVYKIKDILEKDEVYQAQKEPSFEAGLNKLTEVFVGERELKRAKDNINAQKKKMLDVMKKLEELAENKAMSDSSRTAETLKLVDERNKFDANWREALAAYSRQENKFKNEMSSLIAKFKTITASELLDLKNTFLHDINTLERGIMTLDSMPDRLGAKTKNEILSVIGEFRNTVAVFGLDEIQWRSDFRDLCNKYGLKSNYTKIEEIPDVDINFWKAQSSSMLIPPTELQMYPGMFEGKNNTVEHVEPSKPTNLDLNTEKTDKTVAPDDFNNPIKDVRALGKEIVALNKNINVVVDSREVSGSGYEEYLVSDVDPSLLVMPNGWEYVKNIGICNKDDLSLSFKIEQKVEEKKVGRWESKVNEYYETKRSKVTRTRRAQMDPKVKKSVCEKCLLALAKRVDAVGEKVKEAVKPAGDFMRSDWWFGYPNADKNPEPELEKEKSETVEPKVQKSELVEAGNNDNLESEKSVDEKVKTAAQDFSSDLYDIALDKLGEELESSYGGR